MVTAQPKVREKWVMMKDVQEVCDVSHFKLRTLIAQGHIQTRTINKDRRGTYLDLYAVKRYLRTSSPD